MKNSRAALLLFFAALFLFVAPAGSAENAAVGIKILHLNDLHGHILPAANKTGGAAYFGALIERERASNPDGTILLAAGDMFQGTPVSNVFRGKPVTEIMNYLKFDAMTMGNHEFDWGWPQLREIIGQARFPYLAANLVRKDGTPPPGIGRLVYLDRKGVRIALIGVMTPETAFTTNPKNVKDFKLREPEDVLPALIGEARRSGAKLVVVLSHCGFDRDKMIADTVPGIDVIVGGHSHTAVSPPFKAAETLIVQAGSWGNYLGVLDLEIDAASGRILKHSPENLKPVTAGPDSPFDPKIDEIVRKYHGEIKKEFSRVVGKSKTDLLRNPEGESNLGNLICDAMREASGARIAFYNSGGIRANIYKGKVRLEQAFETLPFDNVIVAMDLTGEQVQAILERSASREFGVLQVSGIRVKTRPASPPGSRVEEATVDGRQLEARQVYRVVTNDFLAAGGDRFFTFKKGRNIVYGDDVRDVFIRYLEKRSPVNPRVEGRILVEK